MSGQNSRRNVTHTGQTLKPNGSGTFTHETPPLPLSELREERGRGGITPNLEPMHREVRI